MLRASRSVGAATTQSEPRSDFGATFDKMLSLAPGAGRVQARPRPLPYPAALTPRPRCATGTHTEQELLGAAIGAFTDAGWA